ncbi:N-acetylmuramoyl-L-alanine amidase [Nocardioides nanhaiensis]|uniref:N-acetylmuramoyl-L-alanine amidase n=1 Tax=Nocardioides nanhaiensis TaxID=1476871 RepID=A0ABP8W551_9ACTN
MSLNILPRSAWTSTRNGRAGRPLSKSRVVGIACHYPAAGNVRLAGLSQSAVANRLRGWRSYHVSKGWADIGYNFALDGSGRVWDLTGFNVGAHAGTIGNPSRVGVLFVLGNDEEPPEAMVDAFRELRAHIRRTFPSANLVQGHQQVPGNSTACPGKPVMRAITSGRLTAAHAATPPKPQPVDNRPSVSVKRLRRAATVAGWTRGLVKRTRRERNRVRRALRAEGCKNYAAWQRKLGYKGRDANGVPGRVSLARLGDRYGFRVVA